LSPAQPTALDLRGTPCPLNFIRTKLALEQVAPGELLQVDLDAGDPQQLVTQGLETVGHGVTCTPHPEQEGAVRLLIRRHVG
jgi:TusA-related sulfurtransferase